MQEILYDSIQKMKDKNFETEKEWNRYAVEHNLLSAETIMYMTNKNYQELRVKSSK